MPRKWHTYWPLAGGVNETDRDRIIHTLGNLTLLPTRLNTKVSNGPWLGSGSKREALETHDVLHLNRATVKVDDWTDESIRLRTKELARLITQIWPVPPNHRSVLAHDKPKLRKKVDLSDLIVGGVLQPGMSLFPRRKKYINQVATLLSDGQLEVNGAAFTSASPGVTTAMT